MGYDKHSSIEKCGEILINLKTNKKTKIYIFKCAFCNANCDQLKKFSHHIDDKHSQLFVGEAATPLSPLSIKNNMVNINEHKVEQIVFAEIPSSEGECIKFYPTQNVEPVGINEKDPLETTTIVTKLSTREKSSKDECISEENHEKNMNCNAMHIYMDYEDSAHGSADKFADESKIKCEKFTDISNANSNDTRDADFSLGMVKVKMTKSISRKHSLQEQEITKALLEALKNQPALWGIKLRSSDKVLRHAYCNVAEEINEKLHMQINWQDVRARIQHLRNEYSDEYDKQLKGEQSEMPWNVEHTNSGSRDKKSKYRRLKQLDDSQLSIIIEYYKSNQVLWQVKNIGFVLKSKRKEAIKRILEDLKIKHSIDINIRGMQRRINYINRLYSADKERQFKCDMDASTFVPSFKYFNELYFLADSQGPFQCPHCNEIIDKYETYHQHTAKHSNSIPFKCSVCDKGFSKLDKYTSHARYHQETKSFRCEVCGKIFLYRTSLELHMYEHTGIEPYLCEICGASFRAANGYDNHIRRHEKRFRYECHLCKAGFNLKHSLEAHVKAHLNIRDVLCNVCGKGFTAKKFLQRHQLIHSATKRYKCDVCGKAFAQDGGLRAHRTLHIKYRSLPDEAKKNAIP